MQVNATSGYIRRRQATSGDGRSVLGEQEAAGSNPAIPTKHAGHSACEGRQRGFPVAAYGSGMISLRQLRALSVRS